MNLFRKQKEYLLKILFICCTVVVILFIGTKGSPVAFGENDDTQQSQPIQSNEKNISHNSLYDYNKLTGRVPISNVKSMLEESKIQIADDITKVYTWNDFINAMRNPKTTYITLQNDIVGPSGTNYALAYGAAARNVVIDGNGHQINANNSRISFDSYGGFVRKNEDFNVRFKNISITNAPMYGFYGAWHVNTATTSGSSYGRGKIIYDNINYSGGQIQSSSGFDTEIYGNSKFNINWGSTDTAALQTSNLLIGAGANVELNTNLGNYSPTSAVYPIIDFGSSSGATFNVQGNITFNNNWAMNSGSSTGLIKSNGSNFSLNIADSSQFIFNQTNLWNTYVITATGANSSFNLGNQSKFNINASAGVGSNSGNINNVGGYYFLNYTGNNSSLNTSPQSDFELNVADSANSVYNDQPVIFSGTGSSININQSYFAITLPKSTSSSQTIINLGNSSSLNLINGPELKIKANQFSSTGGQVVSLGTNSTMNVSDTTKISINIPGPGTNRVFNFGTGSSMSMGKGVNVDINLGDMGDNAIVVNLPSSSSNNSFILDSLIINGQNKPSVFSVNVGAMGSSSKVLNLENYQSFGLQNGSSFTFNGAAMGGSSQVLNMPGAKYGISLGDGTTFKAGIGSSSMGDRSAIVNISNGGAQSSFKIGKNANFDIQLNSLGSYSDVINMDGCTGGFQLNEGSIFNIKMADIGNYSQIFSMSNGNIFQVNSLSKFIVELNSAGTYSQILNMPGSSKGILVNDNATLKITVNAAISNNSRVIDMSNGGSQSQLKVGNNANFGIYMNSIGPTSDVINMDNCTGGFQLGESSTFNIKMTDLGSSSQVFSMNKGSVFQVNSLSKFIIELNSVGSSSQVLYMPSSSSGILISDNGTLKISVNSTMSGSNQVIDMSNGGSQSQLKVGNNASFGIYMNSTGTSSQVVKLDNSLGGLDIGEKSLFEIKLTDMGATSDVLSMSGANILHVSPFATLNMELNSLSTGSQVVSLSGSNKGIQLDNDSITNFTINSGIGDSSQIISLPNSTGTFSLGDRGHFNVFAQNATFTGSKTAVLDLPTSKIISLGKNSVSNIAVNSIGDNSNVINFPATGGNFLLDDNADFEIRVPQLGASTTILNFNGTSKFQSNNGSKFYIEAYALKGSSEFVNMPSAGSIFNLGDSSTFDIKVLKNGTLLPSGNIFNLSGNNSGIQLNNNSRLSLNFEDGSSFQGNYNLFDISGQNSYIKMDKNSTFNIDSSKVGTNTLSTANMILMGKNSSVSLQSQSSMNINSKVYSSGSPVVALNFSDNSSINLLDNAYLNINLDFNNPSSGSNSNGSALKMGNSATINANSNSNVVIHSNTSNSSYSLVNLGSSSYLGINNSKLFDLVLTTVDSPSTIINFGSNSTLDSNNQDISASYGNNGKEKRGNANAKNTSYQLDFGRSDFGDLSWKKITSMHFPKVDQAITSTNTYTAIETSSNANMTVSSPSDSVKSSLISNFNPALYQNLTFKQSDATDTVVENNRTVNNSSDFLSAMINPSVTSMDIQSDFALDKFDQGTGDPGDTGRIFIPNKGMTINGNNHTIDLRSANFYTDNNVTGNMNRRFAITNITLYGQSFYGLFNSWGYVKNPGIADIYYNNVNYYGAQLTSSLYQNITIAGKNNVKSLFSYQSPFNGKTYNSQGARQENLESAGVTFEENSEYNGETNSSSVIYVNDPKNVDNVVGNAPIILKKNAQVKLTTNPTNSNNQSPVDGANAPDVLRVTRDVFLGDNASLTLNPRSDENQRALNMAQPANLYVSKSAKLNINLNDRGTMPSNMDVIRMATQSNIFVDTSGEFNINGRFYRASSSSLINATSSNFNVNSKGSLKIKLDGGFNGTDKSSNKLLEFDSSSMFKSDDPSIIDVDIRNMNRPDTVSMWSFGNTSKSFDVSHTKISAWNNNNSTDTPNYSWQSIYQILPSYVSTGVNSVKASGGHLANISDLQNNYRTQNFSRVLFAGYPDINITLNPITSNVNDPSTSASLSGKTSSDAYVTFGGDSKLPAPNLNTSFVGKYNTQADDSGNYSVNLPSLLTSGNTITATAFDEASGKTATASQTVVAYIEAILKILEAPKLDFGTQLIGNNQTLTFSTVNNQNLKVYTEHSKSISISLSISDLVDNSKYDNNKLSSNYLMNNSVFVPNQSFEFYKNSNISDGITNISLLPEEGVKLKLNSYPYIGNYEGIATWTISSGPQK